MKLQFPNQRQAHRWTKTQKLLAHLTLPHAEVGRMSIFGETHTNYIFSTAIAIAVVC